MLIHTVFWIIDENLHEYVSYVYSCTSACIMRICPICHSVCVHGRGCLDVDDKCIRVHKSKMFKVTPGGGKWKCHEVHDEIHDDSTMKWSTFGRRYDAVQGSMSNSDPPRRHGPSWWSVWLLPRHGHWMTLGHQDLKSTSCTPQSTTWCTTKHHIVTQNDQSGVIVSLAFERLIFILTSRQAKDSWWFVTSFSALPHLPSLCVQSLHDCRFCRATGRESPCPWIWQTILPVVSVASLARRSWIRSEKS